MSSLLWKGSSKAQALLDGKWHDVNVNLPPDGVLQGVYMCRFEDERQTFRRILVNHLRERPSVNEESKLSSSEDAMQSDATKDKIRPKLQCVIEVKVPISDKTSTKYRAKAGKKIAEPRLIESNDDDNSESVSSAELGKDENRKRKADDAVEEVKSKRSHKFSILEEAMQLLEKKEPVKKWSGTKVAQAYDRGKWWDVIVSIKKKKADGSFPCLFQRTNCEADVPVRYIRDRPVLTAEQEERRRRSEANENNKPKKSSETYTMGQFNVQARWKSAGWLDVIIQNINDDGSYVVCFLCDGKCARVTREKLRVKPVKTEKRKAVIADTETNDSGEKDHQIVRGHTENSADTDLRPQRDLRRSSSTGSSVDTSTTASAASVPTTISRSSLASSPADSKTGLIRALTIMIADGMRPGRIAEAIAALGTLSRDDVFREALDILETRKALSSV